MQYQRLLSTINNDLSKFSYTKADRGVNLYSAIIIDENAVYNCGFTVLCRN